MPIAPVVVPIVTAAINALSRLFGGGGPPYMERLAQEATPLAAGSGLPVLAFVDDKLIGFFPDGRVIQLGSGANAQTAGPLIENALTSLGAVILVDRIEPFEYHHAGSGTGTGELPTAPTYGTPSQAGVGTALPSTNTMLMLGGAAIAAYLILRKK